MLLSAFIFPHQGINLLKVGFYPTCSTFRFFREDRQKPVSRNPILTIVDEIADEADLIWCQMLNVQICHMSQFVV